MAVAVEGGVGSSGGGGADALLARLVKTGNTQPGGKTVGGHHHRYRLRWIRGIGAHLPLLNPGSGSRAHETSCGTCRAGALILGLPV